MRASCFLNLPLSFILPTLVHLCITSASPISFTRLSATWRWLSSRPVGVERPICGLILLRRRAVNTHFCGCQFSEGRQPCGTQRGISSNPNSGNRAGFKAVRTTLSSFLYPSEGKMLFLLSLPHIDLVVMLCVFLYFLSFLGVNVYISPAHVERHYYTLLFLYSFGCSI